MINIDIWQMIGLFGSVLGIFISCVVGLGKMLSAQIKTNLDARFDTLVQQQKDAQIHIDNRFSTLEQAIAKGNEESGRIERDLMQLKVDVAYNYMRREDFVASHSEIKIRIDGLALKFENALLRGEKHG